MAAARFIPKALRQRCAEAQTVSAERPYFVNPPVLPIPSLNAAAGGIPLDRSN